MDTDLHRVICSKQEITEDHILYFIYQLLCSLYYLHSGRGMHKDIRPSSILLNKDCTLKLCNFETAREVENKVVDMDATTVFVLCRWYKAPELLFNTTKISESIDMWSVGCIMAELLGKDPLFPGVDYIDEIKRIVSVLGTPTKEDLKFLESESAKRYIMSLPKRKKQSFKELYPQASTLAIDLLSRLLVYSPNERCTAEQALGHEYFNEVRTKESEYKAKQPFDWTWGNFYPTKELLQQAVYELGCVYHPN